MPSRVNRCSVLSLQARASNASMWVHSSVVRAADCRSAGPWFKSGCALWHDSPNVEPSKRQGFANVLRPFLDDTCLTCDTKVIMMIGGSFFGNACGNINETCFTYYVTARLAQSAERKALNLVVVGSSPTVGVFSLLRIATHCVVMCHMNWFRQFGCCWIFPLSVSSGVPCMDVVRVGQFGLPSVKVLDCLNHIYYRMLWKMFVSWIWSMPNDYAKTYKGLLRELNPGPLAPEARIMPLDQAAN